MSRQPKGLTFHREFYPDMDRMVKALKIVLALSQPKTRESNALDLKQSGNEELGKSQTGCSIPSRRGD